MIEFVLPTTFRALGVLPQALRMRCDEANFLVALIAWKWASGQADENGFVHLHSEVLERIVHWRFLAPIWRALKAGGVVEMGTHAAGRYSRGYRLTAEYRTDDLRIVPCRDKGLEARILAERERMRRSDGATWLPIHFTLRAMQEGLSAPPAVDAVIDTLAPKPKRRTPEELEVATRATRLGQRLNVHCLRNREGLYEVPSGGRAFNYLTGFARPVRQELLLNGQTIAGVDIVNAQPAVLGMMLTLSGGGNGGTYMRSRTSPPPVPPLLSFSSPVAGPCPVLPLPSALLASVCRSEEFGLFCELVTSGSLYEYLAEECCKAGVALPEEKRDARDWCKRRFLVDLLAKRTVATEDDQRVGKRRTDYASDIGRVVFSRFPRIYDAVKAVNREDEAAMIRLLQAGEAWFVFTQVCQRLVSANVPVVTVHDAIFASEGHVPAVLDAFAEAGEQIGFTFRVKKE
jgi:hypothetical protein